MTQVTRIKLGKVGAGVGDWGLQIYNPSGGLMLDLDGNRTEGFVANAITTVASTTSDTTTTITYGDAETEIASVTLAAAGGFAVVWAWCESRRNVGSGFFHLRIRKDSTSGTILDEIIARTFNLNLLVGHDATPSSNQTYKFCGKYDGGSVGDKMDVNIRTFIAVNMKK